MFRFFSIVVVGLLCAGAAVAADRVALVIGNSAYRTQAFLPNPVNDATDLAAVLEGLGFAVEKHENIDYDGLRLALRDFQRRATGADIALIYYAGHGMEVDRVNYLIPVDAQLKSDRDLAFEAVPLDTALFAVEGVRQLRIVIVDACRDNPFVATMTRSMATRSGGFGLAPVEPSRNMLVAYSAKAGTLARDGSGRNSPFAGALVAALRFPGLEVDKLFRVVRESVLAETGGQQEPVHYASLPPEDIFLHPPQPEPEPERTLRPVPASPDVPALPAGIPPVAAIDPAALAAFDWSQVRDSESVAVLEQFIAKHPGTLYAGLARERLDGLGTLARSVPPSVAPDPDPSEQARRAWQDVKSSESIAVLERFRETHAGTLHAELAAERIAALRPPADPAPVPAAPDLSGELADTSPESLEALRTMPVAMMQAALRALGHYAGQVDGVAGPNTQAATRAFLASLGTDTSEPLTPEQTVVLMKRAAATGDAEAMRHLGLMYMVGLGVVQDRQQAERWLKAATAAGSREAAANLAALEKL